MTKLFLLLLLCISFNTVAQDTLRFETFHRYVEVNKIPPNSYIQIQEDENRTGYIILTTDTIIIVDQYGTVIEYQVYYRETMNFYHINKTDYAYFTIGVNGLVFIVSTKSKNFHYYINPET